MGRSIFVKRLAVVVLISSSLMAVVPSSPTSAGAGDTGCPTESPASLVSGVYEIDTASKLMWLKDNASASKSASYKLTADVSLAGCTWAAGIASSSTPFSGTFDGNNKTISNLTITSAPTVNGLFRALSGSVSNLTLASPSVTSSANGIGALSGQLTLTGSVNNVTLTSVTISGSSSVGGLIGQADRYSTIQNVSISGSVSGYSVVGGLVGFSSATMSDITSSANISVTGGEPGGLVGRMSTGSSLINGTSTGNVTAPTSGTSGGVVGGAVGAALAASPNCPVIRGVSVSGQVTGNSQVGGLIGYFNCDIVIDRSSSSSVVSGAGDRVGGLIGSDAATGSVTKSFFTGQVSGALSVGGLAGSSQSTFTDSFSSGPVTVSTGGEAGGLVGYLRSPGVLTRSYARGLVSVINGTDASKVGGAVGVNSGGTASTSIWDTTSTGRSTSAATASAKGYTAQQMKDYVLYNADNLNWGNITNGVSLGDGITTGTTWSICSGVNAGYPYLTWQGLSGSCQPTMAYNGNGHTGGSAPLDSTTPYSSGSTVTVDGNSSSLVKTGMVFDGWNTKADGTGTSYVSGNTFTITSPVMLFARWTPAISYNSNSGTGSISTVTGAASSSITLSDGTGLTRSNYVLTRWDTSSLGTGTSYSLGQVISMPAGGLTLYAVWTQLPRLAYFANGGTGSISVQYAATGTSMTLSSGGNFARSGFTLSRWDTSSLGTGTSYSLGQVVSMPAGGLNMYAVWTSTGSTTSTSTSTTSTSTTSTTPPSTTSTTVDPATLQAATTTTTTVAPCPEEAPPLRVVRLSVTCPALPAPGLASATTTTVKSATTTTTLAATAVGKSVSSTSTSTTTPPVTTTVPTTPVGPAPDVPNVNPGDTGATIGGRPANPTVTHENGDLVVAIEDATIRYSVTQPNGEDQPIPVGAALTLLPGSEVSVELAGVAPAAQVEVWVVPAGLLLGEVAADNGSGSVTGIIPDEAASSESRLVVRSKTSKGQPLVVAYGVEVAEAPSSGNSWSFALFIIVGLAVLAALFLPAARRRRPGNRPLLAGVDDNVDFIGIYNADGSLLGEISYVLAKHTGRGHCELCDITHGTFRRKRSWNTACDNAGIDIALVHRDEATADQLHVAGDLPAVIRKDGDGWRLVAGPAELAACDGDPERLMSLLTTSSR